jgi:hypothetical protein
MKKWPLVLCALVIFCVFACKKSNSPGSSSSSNAWLSSMSSYSSKSRIVDSFSYDSAHRIARLAQYVFDSTRGYPLLYGFTVDFALPAGSGSAPTSYTYKNIPASGAADLHLLSYDGQGRIIKDASTSSTHFVTNFSYPNNNIASTTLFDGTPLNRQIDTLFMNNGNIGTEHIYLPNNAGTADSLQGSLQFGYASTANPAYHEAIANSIGPLLFLIHLDGYGGLDDFLSKNILNKISGTGLTPGGSLNYSLSNDSKGRLSSMTASYGGQFNTITFRYY